ncbi:spermidine/putrescine ABC transporter substrate-binding protein [Candidatus Acetothermia bacterium]|nr:spermidine/putrescine ABC transporter substrate-binding protein [Candidatus Acetothermia bacterium]MBI3643199.1 spermidine/putrescine ABC transporter substrate-binding protein [Candidatus Acetothermia bacterium]
MNQEKVQPNGLSRREFLKKTGAAGLGFYVAGALLRSQSAFASDMPTDLLDAVAKEDGKLNIFNWSYYIAEDPVTDKDYGVDLTDVTPTIEKFQQEFNISVTYDTFESQEEMLAKVRPGGSGYDVVVFTNYYVPQAKGLKLIQPLDRSWLTNAENLLSRFQGPPFGPDPEFVVPYLWGVTGYAYNQGAVHGDSRVGHWSLLFRGNEYKNKMTMLDSVFIDGVNAALAHLGFSINERSRVPLLAAGDVLMEQKPLLQAYTSGTVRDQLATGDVLIAQLWTGDALAAQQQNAAIQFAFPNEGSDVWVDSMSVLAESKRPATAHLWMNYILRPRVAAGIATWVAYATPNNAALDFIPEAQRTSTVIYPSDDDLKNYALFVLPEGDALALRQQIADELLG